MKMLGPLTVLGVLAVLLLVGLAHTMRSPVRSVAQPDGYNTICVSQTLPGGKKLPEVCVYDPLNAG